MYRGLKQKITDTVDVQLSGSNIAYDSDSDALLFSRANIDDVILERTEKIIDIIGRNDIRLFLTFSESEAPYKDALRSDVMFGAYANTSGSVPVRKSNGLFGNYLDCSGGYIAQLPITQEADPTATTTYYSKVAVQLKDLGGCAGVATLLLKKIGDVDSASVRVAIYSDNSGVPGEELFTSRFTNENEYTSILPGSSLTDSFGDWGFALRQVIPLKRTDNWLVLEYVDSTGVDASNYVGWGYKAKAGAKRATYDSGTETWTIHDGETQCFALYDDLSRLEEDFSIIWASEYTGTGTSNGYVFRLPNIDNVSILYALLFGGTKGKYHFSLYQTGGAATARMITEDLTNGWHTQGISFSKARSSWDKMQIFTDGRKSSITPITSGVSNLVPGFLGFAHQGIQIPCQPLTFTVGISSDGKRTSNWKGNIGPIIIANRKLSEEEFAQIHTLLTVKSKGGK